MESNTTNRTTALKALSIVGFIAILIFGVWGLIQVARMVPNLFSSIQGAAVSLSSVFTPSEKLTLSLESGDVMSGESFILSWEHKGSSKDGTYRVAYGCREGVAMVTPDSRGTYQKVNCEAPFNLNHETSSMKLIAFSEAVRYVDVPLTLTFTRNSDGKVLSTAQTTITITNEKLSSMGMGIVVATSTPVVTPVVPVTPTKTPTKVVKPVVRKPVSPTGGTYTVVTNRGRISDPSGRPDLSVTIMQTGVIDPASNIFIATPGIKRGGRGAVRFVVENLGSKSTDNWYFNAVVPTYPMYIYSADMQSILGPGDKIEYTLGFDQADPTATNGLLTINVDPAGSIYNEVTKNNNIARASFSFF